MYWWRLGAWCPDAFPGPDRPINMKDHAMNTQSLVITYGTHSVDFATLPEQSVKAILKRGLTHFLGSEQASKVTAYFDPERKLADGETRLEDNEANRDAIKAKFQAAAIDALLAGTVGVSTRGPAADPLEVEINRIAKREIVDILKSQGVKAPKKAEDTVTIGGQAFTIDQLVARRLDPTGPAGVDKKTGTPHADRIAKEAKKVLDDKAKAAKKAAEKAAEAGGVDAL